MNIPPMQPRADEYPSLQQVRDADLEAWRQAMLQWQRGCEQHFSLRDTFAAAALAARAIPENGLHHEDTIARQAYGLADAMLRERLRNGAVSGCETVQSKTTLDASPEAIATADRYVRRAAADGDSDRTDKAAPRPSDGTGDTPLDVEELLGRLQSLAESGEGSTYAIRTTACDAECAIERLRAWVNELQLSKVEIDALQHVVEGGRLVDLADYGRLRSLLARLRPEWEGADRSQPVKDAESDRSKPINADRLAALDELSALDQELEREHGIKGNPMIKARPCKAAKTDTTPPRNGALSGCETVPDPDSRVWETPRTPQPHATPPQGSVQGDGSVPCSRTGNDPAAWAVTMGDGSVYEAFAAHQYDEAVALARKCLFGSDLPLPLEPLYRHPQPTLTETEAETLRELRDEAASAADEIGLCSSEVRMRQSVIDGLLERLR